MPLLLLLLLLLNITPLSAAPREVSIGVLSHRGAAATLATWSATADYISSQLPDYRFTIRPLRFDEVTTAVAGAMVDFVLANPGIYVDLEVSHRVSRIATLNNRRAGQSYNLFGGVLFSRAERSELKRISDLRGQRLLAVDETSLGGFRMAWGELLRSDLQREDLAAITFAGTHDAVVLGVLQGAADVGTVRTDILERMQADGRLDRRQIRIINARYHAGFPFAHSTELYPEWPFSKVRHTPNELAQQVAVALLNMPPDHPAALAGQYAGWTIPLDYQPVHELFRQLKVPPYDRQLTLFDVAHLYWRWLLAVGLLLLLLLAMSLWVMRLNRRMARARLCLQQQHDLILNSVADGIYGVDPHGNATFVNRALERITGWSAAEMIGHNQHQLLHHTHADGTPHHWDECPVMTTCHDRQPRYVESDLFWRKDGSSFPVAYSCNPIEDERGALNGAVVVFRDTTGERVAEEERRQHQLELAHVARLAMMGEMATGIAHEVNQPLSAIANYTRGSIRMLQRGDSDSTQLLEAMERVAAQAERAGGIIRQLRSFLRKEQPPPQPVAINPLIRNLVSFIAPELRRNQVQLQLTLSEPLPLLTLHTIQIEQVLLNLMRNAMDALQEQPAAERRLTLYSGSAADRLLIRVSDNGAGLSAAVADRLFQPFVTTKPQGMGLGLSISRNIIEAHHGSLTVVSDPGAGCAFTIQLPVG